MAMKKRDAVEAIRGALTKSLRSGAKKVGFVVPEPGTSAPGAVPLPRTPDFEFSGWLFFALNGPFEDEPLNDGGDAKLRAPDGSYIGLVWKATGKLSHRFDFDSMYAPMLYVDVPDSVATFAELRPYFEALVPALEADMRGRK
jgi:hypothetical protein